VFKGTECQVDVQNKQLQQLVCGLDMFVVNQPLKDSALTEIMEMVLRRYKYLLNK